MCVGEGVCLQLDVVENCWGVVVVETEGFENTIVPVLYFSSTRPLLLRDEEKKRFWRNLLL